MKLLLLCCSILLCAAKSIGQVVKFRTAYTSSSERYGTKWSEWVDDSKEGKDILVVRDLDKNTITTYGQREKKLSVISLFKMKQKNIEYDAWEAECVDEENEKCTVFLLYPKDTEKNYTYLILQYGSYRIRFVMDRE